MQVILSPRASAHVWYTASRVEARANAIRRGDTISNPTAISPNVPSATTLLQSMDYLPEDFSTSYSATELRNALAFFQMESHASVAVFDSKQRRSAAGENVLLSPAFQQLQFARLSDELLVCPPEICLMTASKSLSPEHFLLLAYEYCGKYALDLGISRGMGTRPALTSTQSLADFLKIARGSNGAKRLRWALKWLCDGSESPRESCMAAVFCMPKARRGYGFGKVLLNKEIPLGEHAQKVYGRKSCRADLLIPGTNLIFEYDSDAEHSSGANQRKDTRRETALSMEGYEVHSVTNSQINSVTQMDGLAKIIAHRLGHSESFLERGQESRRALLKSILKRRSWNSY